MRLAASPGAAKAANRKPHAKSARLLIYAWLPTRYVCTRNHEIARAFYTAHRRLAFRSQERFNGEKGGVLMADNAVPTLVPEQADSHSPQTVEQRPPSTWQNSERETLLDSIVQEPSNDQDEIRRSPLRSFFTVLLWVGYAIAIVVALTLVWTAASALFKSYPN